MFKYKQSIEKILVKYPVYSGAIQLTNFKHAASLYTAQQLP